MIYYDESGAPLDNPDLTAGYLEPRETIHHSAVAAVTHKEVLSYPGGSLTYMVVDIPARAAWDEVTSYTYRLNPPTKLDEMQAQINTMRENNDAAHSDVFAAITELGDLLCGLL